LGWSYSNSGLAKAVKAGDEILNQIQDVTIQQGSKQTRETCVLRGLDKRRKTKLVGLLMEFYQLYLIGPLRVTLFLGKFHSISNHKVSLHQGTRFPNPNSNGPVCLKFGKKGLLRIKVWRIFWNNG